jgi:hypothetical protein
MNDLLDGLGDTNLLQGNDWQRGTTVVKVFYGLLPLSPEPRSGGTGKKDNNAPDPASASAEEDET